jgi:hypothetical protein
MAPRHLSDRLDALVCGIRVIADEPENGHLGQRPRTVFGFRSWPARTSQKLNFTDNCI